MADAGAGLQSSLKLLQESLSAADRCGAAMSSCQLIRGLGQECVLSCGSAVMALQTSLVFSKEFGLLVFVQKSLGIEEFRDCREEILKFLCVFLEKIGEKVMPYALDVKNICTSVYTKDKAAKCKIPALELLIKSLQMLRSSRLMGEFRIGELFNKFYGELAWKSKIPDTVLEKIYELLGVLGEVQPSEMINNSENLFRAFLGELKTQMTSTVREPKLLVVAGCLKGLSSLMCNFTKSVEEDPQTSKEIFDFALKAICPRVDLKRYAVPLAGLRLFSLHASQFSTYLLDNDVCLFEIMSKWCSHTNLDLKKAGLSALESFLKQVSVMVAKEPEKHENKLQYFMEQFYGIIRNVDSSNKDLSIAIRGYGLFAGPCKAIRATDVDLMYVELIQRCKQLFLMQTDTTEDHVYHMPSFLQSIASVLLHLDTVPEAYTPVLEHLMVVQMDSFPQYSPKMQSVCCRAIVKVFLALAEKGPVLWNCISTVVHQGLIRICSKPVILQKSTDTEPEDPRASGEVRTGKWKVPTYKDYLGLFRNLLSCDQTMDSLLVDESFLFVNSSLKSLNRLLYDEFVKSILKIVEKLDLTLEKQNVGQHEDEEEATGVWVIPTSDPAANLHPAKPKDFSAFINLVEFCREILPEKHVECFEPWVHSFAYELITQSTRLPLISGFYKLLTVALRNAKKIKYFEGISPKSQKQPPEHPEKSYCFALFSKFGKEVSVKMKQYKDELLASCLTFILTLPHHIVELDVKAYIPALQTAFKLGLSYPPLAEVGLNALEEWSVYICRSIIQPYYKDILPCLDGYLKTAALADENKNSLHLAALSRAAQKGFNKVVVKHLKKTKTVASREALSLQEIRVRVVQMLGSLGGQINKNLLTAASSDEMMKKYVAWDREKQLSFAVPFMEMKPVIYLDIFLPRVTELALTASDRQTKVAACELLHSVVMFMLGKATQMPEVSQGPPPLYGLYKHTFPVLLRLACDVDQVTRQLYEPLVMQLIHWFTNNKKFESQDTVALLEAILDGIVDPNDSTLRDFSGQCIREFLKWSIKQTTPQQQERSPVNTKSLFKRLYSLALHPNAFKRLGASLAFNNIYREFREEESLVEQFAFEALVTYMESLALAHTDEKSLGTVQQCCDAIDHLSRIIEKKHVVLNKPKKRRWPRGFPPGEPLCLLNVVEWLLARCGRPQTECRHKSMELFYKFVPLLPGNKSPSCWLKDAIQKEAYFLVNTFEGGGADRDRPSGILAQPTLRHILGPFSLRATLQWLDMLLAALECYNTFLRERMLGAPEMLGSEARSSLWEAVSFFLENIAMHDVTAAERCFGSGAAGSVLSPQERETYNYSKCTIVVRIMEFATTLLSSSSDTWQLPEKGLFSTHLLALLARTVCEPLSVGFNVGDVLVMERLPAVCVDLMRALRRSPHAERLERQLRAQITAQSIEELCSVDLYGPDTQQGRARLASVVSAGKQLHKAGLLHVILTDQSAGQHHTLGVQLLSLVYRSITPGHEGQCLPTLDPGFHRLASGLLELAFAFGGLCQRLVGLLLDRAVLSMPSSGGCQRSIVSFAHGAYFYSLFSETINAELMQNLDVALEELMKSSVDNPKMVSTVLNGLLDQSFRDRASQKQQGLKLVTAILHHWRSCESWWTEDSSSESKTAVLTLLAKILQIDSSVSFNTKHSAFPEVFRTYTALLGDPKLGLHLKGQAVILLPFFTNLTGDSLDKLQRVLDNLVVSSFPMKSEEFPPGTLRYNNYVDCVKKFLDALELSRSPVLLRLMTDLLCREQHHVMEELFQSTFRTIAQKSSLATQLDLLESVYRMFQRDDLLSNATRQAIVDRSLLTLLWQCSLEALRGFFSKIVVAAVETLKSRFLKLNESTFDTQITKKMSYYKMLEVMYSRLPKDDVHSKESRINQAFHGSSNTEGSELTKALIKLCYDAFTENMAGETQLLERRRLYHCAAYNCAISLICCVFREMKFYQGFLFSEKPEKNVLILENLIDTKRCYEFPVEVEVPMERKKKYIEIRKEAREAAHGGSGDPHYLSSLSYLADSSLSEEMSQFDFSTGVQSYSYSSQDPKSTTGHFRRRERKDPTTSDESLELEMDELNQHECMAPMTALLKHMQRSQLLPREQEGSAPASLPPWMKFLHDKLGNPSTSLNIRLFLAKLIVNTEEVFRSCAKHWLGPLLQLVVSENNGGEGIHYLVVEIVATVLSWTGVATPAGVPKDEVLANRLLHFLMKHVFHQKRAVFRHNLEIVKTLVECWKDCLAIPYRLIFEKFASKDSNSKDNSVGIQLLGIVMANNLPPYDPKCGIESMKYFQALVNNMSFVKFKEVYAAAAEVLGLILRHVAEREQVLEEPLCELIVKQLKQHQQTMEDKFIMCLNKVVKNFPPLADRFLNSVFYLLPKFHGVMKTLCLEVVLCRAEEIADLYLQLKSKNFIQVMRHRDDERQKVCLDIIYKMMAKLKPAELLELLTAAADFLSHPSAACRERMYSILMWVYDNYRDPESQMDDDSQEIFKLAKDVLVQGLTDENLGLQLIIRNFWSHETRLPSNILDRLLAINSLYSPKIETHFLSLATDFLLEMTSMSPDYSNPMFEHPLSECEFQEYTIESHWRFRSTVLTPMFVETQASQSTLQAHNQEGSLPDRGVPGRQIRATQQQADFTPTQNTDGRSSFNWLTGSSIDPLMDHSGSSASDASSSFLLFARRRTDSTQRTALKSVGPDFGKKRLGLPGDEVDSRAKGVDNRAEILRLRRRFLKDQEKLSLIYARKGIAEQKREEELKSELKLKRDAQVVLYRSYRQGDLPDIQIKHSSLITPLQAVAQRDPIIAKQLFGSLFCGILKEMDKSKTVSEKASVMQKLLQDFNRFLTTTFSFFPPFVACIQEISCRHPDLLNLDPPSVSAACLAGLQQPAGVRLLEEALLHLAPPEPPAKRVRGRPRLAPDVLRWMELAKLYRSLGEYDVLHGIFSSEIGAKQLTQDALAAEARSDYSEAARQYDQALNKQDWVDGEPAEAEKDFWELASLDCYNRLAEWKSLAYCSTASVDSASPPDLSKMWSEPFYQETYLPYMIRSKLKLLLLGEADQALLTFMDDAVSKELSKVLIELHYSQELSLLYILQDDVDRAKYYIEQCIHIFMQNYSSIDVLLHRSRLTKLQSVQTLIEIQEFIDFIGKQGNFSSQAPLKRLLRTWTNRYPDAKMDPMNIWDDIVTNRCFFLSKIEEKFSQLTTDHDVSLDSERESEGRMDVQEEQEEAAASLIRSCKFSMKMRMVESARKQSNFSLALKLLKELHREAKTREDWKVQWAQSYCRLSHSRSRSQSRPEQLLTVLKTVSLLDESRSSYLSRNTVAFRDQNILLGTTYRMLADTLSSEPGCLSGMEESKAQRIVALSAASPEHPDEVAAGLYQRAFRHLLEAVHTAEEEAKSDPRGQESIAGMTKAYMTLVDFCDQQLRKEEEGAPATGIGSGQQTYPALVVEKMLSALKLHSHAARLRFPRLLQIVERYPEETLSLMTKQMSCVPCWQFIGWISHLVALLDKEEAVAAQHTVEELADHYPQAIVYPFIISSESYCFSGTATGHKNKEFVERIKGKLDQGGIIHDFINALEQLSNPEMLFKDWTEDMKVELAKSPVNKKTIEKMYEQMYAALGQPKSPGVGPFRKKFIQAFGKEFDRHFGRGGSKLFEMKVVDFAEISSSLLSKMNASSKPPGNLKEWSPWMSGFQVEFLRSELEIPGQYDGNGKPLPEYHVRIAGFDERVKVMASIRKPKRVVIRGHDEREYPFLVKGGEDLRQDQRLQQLFQVMNGILRRDAACGQRNLQLSTYRVVPMTSRLGLIEWIENTVTLKELLLNAMSQEEKAAYHSDFRAPLADYKDWLRRISGKRDLGAYMLMYKRASRTETVTSFRKRESQVPPDLLKRAFLAMSAGPEAFLALRAHCASSHALLCISHWVLGIGDRHLNNFLISTETGGAIGIDFGHAFGSATQFLPVPELMPFRLTRQFVNLMLPLKQSGVTASVMVHALRAFRDQPGLLLSCMDVFVREPSFDWKNFEQKMLKKRGSWIQEVNVTEKNWYPRQKINYAKRKLEGANPAVITCDELRLGHETAATFGDFTAVARGSTDYNVRAQEPESGLSEEAQVKCLIDQATDPNILGRTWEGWEPWM